MAAPASPLFRPVVLFTSQTFALLIALASLGHAAPKWDPIHKEELAETKPKVDPDAGAEILLRKMDFNYQSLPFAKVQYYLRAKIFSQKGIERFSLVEIPYPSDVEITDLAARTIKPDGTCVELDPKDVYDREVLKLGRVETMQKSFALPALVPGAVVEYQYSMSSSSIAPFVRLVFPTDLPARQVEYNLRPRKMDFASNPFLIRAISYNCPDLSLEPDKKGDFHFKLFNIPAVKDEPYQPPLIDVWASVIVYERSAQECPPETYWATFARDLQKRANASTKSTRALRTTLSHLITSVDSDREKLRKIYDYCRTNIVNRDRTAAPFTPRQRETLKENYSADDTLKCSSGTGDDINVLFAALARTAGLNIRFAACNDRTFLCFNSRVTEPFMMPKCVIAVHTDGDWKYFDPGTTYLPLGMLSWQNTDTSILMSDRTGQTAPQFEPGAPAESSVSTRKADFSLSADGTLAGTVIEEYTGLCGTELRDLLDGKSAAECETYVRNTFQEYQKNAELTSVSVKNASSPVEPLNISYHLRISSYAVQTGTRLFFQPEVFQKGIPSKFEAKTRQTDILFPYRTISKDEIILKLPPGYVLEEGSAPRSIDFGEFGSYEVNLKMSADTGRLIYSRMFKRLLVYVPRDSYPALKQAYDAITSRDGHTFTLRKTEPSDPAISAASPETSTAPQPAGPAAKKTESGA